MVKNDQKVDLALRGLYKYAWEEKEQAKEGKDTDVDEYVLCSVFPLWFPFMNVEESFDVMCLERGGQ